MNNWCPDVYKNMYIEPVNDDHVKVAACCQASPSEASVVELNFQSNAALSALRENFNRGIRASECHHCWRLEDLGVASRRNSVLSEYNFTVDNIVELKSLDINVTWACNLACVMCGPQWSSTWSKELGTKNVELDHLGRKSQKNNPFMGQLDLSQIERVHFNGGEPLINNNHLDVLQRLSNSKSLAGTSVSYNTNGTIIPDSAVIDLWSQAKLVKLYFSIDATEKAFEYIRWPAKWLQVASNMQQMVDIMPSNVMFGLNVTVGCYNIFEIVDVWNWFNTHIPANREGDASDFCWQFAHNFDVDLLNLSARAQAIKHLDSYDVFDGVVKQLQTTDLPPSTKWIGKFDNIDRRRQTNWRDALAVATYY